MGRVHHLRNPWWESQATAKARLEALRAHVEHPAAVPEEREVARRALSKAQTKVKDVWGWPPPWVTKVRERRPSLDHTPPQEWTPRRPATSGPSRHTEEQRFLREQFQKLEATLPRYAPGYVILPPEKGMVWVIYLYAEDRDHARFADRIKLLGKEVSVSGALDLVEEARSDHPLEPRVWLLEPGDEMPVEIDMD
jgi:hypothetical protein